MVAWVALASEAAAFVLVVSVLARLLVSQQRAHARREDLLLNQLLATVGKPWQPAPASEQAAPAAAEPRSWTATPEQQPLG